MGRLADLDAEMHELPDSEKDKMRAYVLGFEAGEAAEQERIIKILNDTANDYLSDKLLVEAAIIINAIAYIKNFGE
jgi:hypothetical protein